MTPSTPGAMGIIINSWSFCVVQQTIDRPCFGHPADNEGAGLTCCQGFATRANHAVRVCNGWLSSSVREVDVETRKQQKLYLNLQILMRQVSQALTSNCIRKLEVLVLYLGTLGRLANAISKRVGGIACHAREKAFRWKAWNQNTLLATIPKRLIRCLESIDPALQSTSQSAPSRTHFG